MLLPTLTFALLATLTLGFWVFALAPGRRENQVFAVFTWLTSLWVANDLSFWAFHGPDTDGMSWARNAFLLAVALQLAFLAFAWVFPRARPVPRLRLALVLAPAALLIPVILWGEPLQRVGFRDGAFELSLTPWTFALGAYIYGLFLLGRVVVGLRRRSEDTPPAIRKQLGVVMLSPSLTAVLTTVVIVILPLLGTHDLLPYVSLGILAGAVIHSYAALNMRFLKPASALDELRLFPVTAKLSLAVAAFWFVTVVVVICVVQLSADRDPSPRGWQRAWVFALALGSLPAMGLILVAQRIVSRPLRAIGEAAVEVTRGRTDVRVDVNGGGSQDEVTLLAAAFNDMLARLEDDLDTQRETNQNLLRTERLAVAGSLAAGVAHEVNNPLAAISSLVQTARSKTDDAEARALLGEALGHMDRISGALRDLLDFARAPAMPNRRPCRLEEIVEGTLRLLRYDKRFRALELDVIQATDLPDLEGDPGQLQQVVMNLLLNARDAVEARLADDPSAPAALTVTTRRAAGGVELKVADTGCGIPPEHTERLFEPFFTTKPTGAGTGLGLAVCHDLVRLHDGRIDVESAPNRGTIMTVTLPGTGPSDPPDEKDAP